MLTAMMLTNAMPTLALPPGVQAWMTTRAGGHSTPPWDGFNLGDHVGDDPAAVRANRQALATLWGAQPVFLQQVHGTHVVELGGQGANGGTVDGAQADACFSFAPGWACTVMVADCLPVLLWDAKGRWVAAAHAGWRGLAGASVPSLPVPASAPQSPPVLGVLEALWQRLQARGAQAADTRAALGPCIGPLAFEVGDEVRRAFVQADQAAQALFRPSPNAQQPARWLADLPGLARQRLQRMGIGPAQVQGNDGTAQWCTVAQSGLFFSHRRDAIGLGSTGRMAAGIWIS